MKLKYKSLLLVIHLLFYPLLTIIYAQDSLYLIGTITGESTTQRIGGAIGIGDVNGDGYDDFIIPTRTGNTIDTIPKHILFGGGITSLGDINGDGRKNFIIRSEEGTNIYFSLDSVLTLRSGINTIQGEGDINNDGYDDFVRGYYNHRNSDSLMVGGAFIYLGSQTIDTVYKWRLEGETKWSLFGGTSFADINGDGYDDLLISASNYPDHENPLGKVYIYSYIKIVNSVDDNENIPNSFKLFQNYPNPFNPKTIITWQLLVRSQVKVTIYNMLGSKVVTLIDEVKTAGNYENEFDASKYHLSSGVYFCELKIKRSDLLIEGVRSQRIKMVLIK